MCSCIITPVRQARMGALLGLGKVFIHSHCCVVSPFQCGAECCWAMAACMAGGKHKQTPLASASKHVERSGPLLLQTVVVTLSCAVWGAGAVQVFPSVHGVSCAPQHHQLFLDCCAAAAVYVVGSHRLFAV